MVDDLSSAGGADQPPGSLDAWLQSTSQTSGRWPAWRRSNFSDVSQILVSDVSPLASLGQVTSLGLSTTGVSFADVRALPFFAGLRELSLDELGIGDISGLAGLPLQHLRVQGNPIVDLAPLSRVKTLQTLYLADTLVTDVGPLSELVDLWYLELRQVPERHFGPVAVGVLARPCAGSTRVILPFPTSRPWRTCGNYQCSTSATTASRTCRR